MGFIRSRIERRSSVVNPFHPGDPGISSLFPVNDDESAVDVTNASAMTLSSIWAAVNLLSKSVASLPLVINRKLQPKGRERDPSHPLYDVLHNSPNDDQTSFEFREMLQSHLCLRGNGFAEIIQDRLGIARELVPLLPDHVRPVRSREGGLFYEQGSGASLPERRVLHLRGLASNGLMGLSVVSAARRSIGIAISAERFGGKFFSNSARPSGVLKMPGTLDAAATERLKASWDAAHKGVDNSSNTAVLENGLEYQQIGLAPEDAQFLETRKFSTTQVAQWFGVPPHMIHDLERSTFSNIEHQDINFVVHSLRPWLTRWEQRLEKVLMTPEQRRTHEIRFIVEGLLRGDSAARASFYQQQFNVGSMSRNEIRELEGLNPVEGGESYFVPLNMIPADQAETFYQQPQGLRSAKPPQEIEVRTVPPVDHMREVRARGTITEGFKPMFLETFERIMRAELRELRKGIASKLDDGTIEIFSEWLDERYSIDGEFRDWIAAQTSAPIRAIVASVDQSASASIGAEPVGIDELSEFAGLVALSAANRHVSSSRGQLRKLIADNAQTIKVSLEAKMDIWADKRPARSAAKETVKTSRAAARESYVRGGITRFQWVTRGNNCPFCDSLDGKIVGVEGSFAEAGDMLEAEGRKPLRINRKVLHAPVHGGCDCDIIPVGE